LSDSSYSGFVPMAVEIDDRRFYVGVHLASVGGRLTCVGIDLRAVNFGSLPGAALDMGNGDWAEVTTSIVRGLPLGRCVDQAIDEHRSRSQASTHPVEPLETTTAEASSAAERSRRRGPRPLLEEGVLAQIVGPAYRLGGRRPVQAVREALDRAGVLATPTTMDQARRAVVRARARGYIEPRRPSSTGRRAET